MSDAPIKDATVSAISGHPMGDAAHAVAKDQLRSIVDRIERLEEEKKVIGDDIKDVYAEAKANGFDTKVLRKVVTLRKQDANERAEMEMVLDTYLHALGMIIAREERTAEAA